MTSESKQTLNLSQLSVNTVNGTKQNHETSAHNNDDETKTAAAMGCIGRSKFAIVTISLQIIFLIFFGIFGKYRYDLDTESRWFYPMFQNVHVMIFIGFGFLMTFLKKYGYSAVSVTFFIAALVLQWHMIFKNLIEMSSTHKYIYIGMKDLITADFTAAAVLISFGAVIGKTSPLQLITMAILEVIIFSVNELIAVMFGAADIGGSMVVHIFGAYFGLAVARVLYKPFHSESSNEGSNYNSDIFSMLGTVFLWLYWPSFNAAVAGTEEQQIRAVINTYLSMSSCCLITFAVSTLTNKKAKFDMVHVQNATLAGGVAVGTAANFMINPWGAILIGFIAAIVSTLGFQYLQPKLDEKLGLHDSCGVNNLHGMPGIMAAIVGIIAAATATEGQYQLEDRNELSEVFPAMVNGTRTAGAQAGYQAATLGVTLAMALVGGALTGLVMRFVPGLDAPESKHLFSDEKFFEVADDFGAYSDITSNSNSNTSTSHHDEERVKDLTKM